LAITWKMINREHSHEDAGRDAEVDDRQTLNSLRAIRA
jgi:hypothetical protein